MEGYGFLSFAKSTRKNIGKSISKNLSDKYSKKLIYHAEQYATALETASKRANQNKAKATGYLIVNKIANKATKVSRTSPQNTLETVPSETSYKGLIN